MDFKDVELLLTLHAEKSITNAAKKLYISQPALTKRIQKLEDFFQNELITRQHNGVAFTHEGEKLVSYCQELNLIYQNLLGEMARDQEEIRGSLNLGVATIYAHYRLPKLIQSYLDKYPKVKVDIQTGNSAQIYRKLQNNEITLAIIREGYAWEDGKLLLSNESLCLASHEKIDLDSLPTKNYIHYKTDPHLEYQIEHWWNERFSVRPNIDISTSSIDTSIELVRAGAGWSVLPAIALENFDGYVQELKWLNGLPFTRATWLFYRKSNLAFRAVSSFVQHMEGSLQQRK